MRRRIVAAVLAWMLVPRLAAAQAGQIAPRSDDPGPGPAPAGPPAPPPPPDEVPPNVAHLALGAGGHVAFGSAPAVALGLTVAAEVDTGRWSVGLEGRYDFPASAHTTQGATARTSLAGVALVPCLRAARMWACAVVLLAHVEADATEPGAPGVSDGFFFLGIGGRLALHAGLPWDFALRIGGEVLAHPIPFELTQNGHQLYKSSAVSTTIGPALVRVF